MSENLSKCNINEKGKNDDLGEEKESIEEIKAKKKLKEKKYDFKKNMKFK